MADYPIYRPEKYSGLGLILSRDNYVTSSSRAYSPTYRNTSYYPTASSYPVYTSSYSPPKLVNQSVSYQTQVPVSSIRSYSPTNHYTSVQPPSTYQAK